VSKAWVVDDELRELIEPVLPPWPDKAPGPPPGAGPAVPARHLFVLHTGIG
jgi:hypothetical protein